MPPDSRPPESPPPQSTALVPAPPPEAAAAGDVAITPTALGAAALEAAKAYARLSLAPSTCRAYQADWAHFFAWCLAAGLPALPAAPATVGAYLAALAPTHARASLRRRLAAIGQMQLLHGCEWVSSHPQVRAPLRGMLRQHGAPARRAAALGTAEIRRLIAACDAGRASEQGRGRVAPTTAAGGQGAQRQRRSRVPRAPAQLAAARDRALLLLGYAAALRRAELPP